MRSRTQSSAINILTGVGGKFLTFILAFSLRTVFIRLLGAEYNGVSGLFINILSFFSLAELGVTNVLNYSLYKVLKDNDIDTINLYMVKFKRIYHVIAFSILGMGLLFIPFLHLFVKSSLPFNMIIIYYLLYLFDSVVSYFVAYKTSLIVADQKRYIVNICVSCGTFATYLIQIAYLFFRRDFLGYLIIQVICTIGRNVVLNFIANRHYPYIKNPKNIGSRSLNLNELKQNIKATFVYKVSTKLLNNITNIVISAILGTVTVGYYFNYYLIIQYIDAYIYAITTGLLASIGNFNVSKSESESYDLFKTSIFIFSVITNVCICALLNCYQEFIPIWIGKEFLLGWDVVAAILLLFYIHAMSNPSYLFREAMGLFKEVKYTMVFAAVFNIIFSIIGGYIIGLAGIIFASSLARLLTNVWYEPLVIYRKKFKNEKIREYVWLQIKYLGITIVSLILTVAICCQIPFDGIFGVLLRGTVSVLTALLVSIIVSCKTQEYLAIKNKILSFLKIKRKAP